MKQPGYEPVVVYAQDHFVIHICMYNLDYESQMFISFVSKFIFKLSIYNMYLCLVLWQCVLLFSIRGCHEIYRGGGMSVLFIDNFGNVSL